MCLVTQYGVINLVNIGSGNDLVRSGTKSHEGNCIGTAQFFIIYTGFFITNLKITAAFPRS